MAARILNYLDKHADRLSILNMGVDIASDCQTPHTNNKECGKNCMGVLWGVGIWGSLDIA